MIKVKIVTPDGEIYTTEDAEYITVSAEIAELMILEEHAPTIGNIAPGEITIKEKDRTELIEIAVAGGIYEIRQDSEVNILADMAVHGGEIDLEKAREAIQKAEEYIDNHDEDDENFDYARLQSVIAAEQAKINLGNRYRDLNQRKNK